MPVVLVFLTLLGTTHPRIDRELVESDLSYSRDLLRSTEEREYSYSWLWRISSCGRMALSLILRLVKTMRKAMLLLMLGSLASGAWFGSFCASCGSGGEMDCCKHSRSKLPALSTPSCCESQWTAMAEDMAAIVAKQNPPVRGSEAGAIGIESAGRRVAGASWRSPSPPLKEHGSPPLFLLHGSLLR